MQINAFWAEKSSDCIQSREKVLPAFKIEKANGGRKGLHSDQNMQINAFSLEKKMNAVNAEICNCLHSVQKMQISSVKRIQLQQLISN